MSELPNIDIIIPNYNKANYLEECLNSVISQSYKNWRIYLIDDNSNDNSKTILKKYEKNEKFKIFYLKENHGPAYCRNLGIKNSNSDYVAFLDSDDFWPHNKLEVQIKYALDNNYSFTYTDYKFFYNDDLSKKVLTNLPVSYSYKNFLMHSSMSTSSILLERQILKNTPFESVKHEDYLFKCKILRNINSAYKVKDIHVFYRINKNNRSSNKVSNLFNLWLINKNKNNLSFLENLKSIISISFNSLKTYGWK